jgi:PAS domain S-box-containing protein
MLETNDRKRPPTKPVPEALIALLRASDGILDLLPVGTFICDLHGTILQFNRRATEIWGRTPQPGQTHDAFLENARYFEVDGTPLHRSVLIEALQHGKPLRNRELMIERHDGSRIFVSINIDPLRSNGDLVGTVNCFTDITERKRIDVAFADSHQHALEQEQRLAATYEHAAIGIAEVAPDGHFLRVNEAVCVISGFSREDLLANKLFTHTHADDADADREGFRKQVAGLLEFYSVEKRLIRKDGRVVWLSVRSSSVRSSDGHLLYVVRVMQDITQRKAAESRQKLLIDELNHRVKNTLATVQSLAAQTSRGAPDPRTFRERFEGRLIALSKAHDQLTRHHWESADLRELLSGSLAPYAAGAGGTRVLLRGEDFVLRPRAVLTLAMAVHELTTNAAKYGALSVPNGTVHIHWQPLEDGGRRRLYIEWIERGGPEVRRPKQTGFGAKLIEHSIAAELSGKVGLIYAPEGLRCEISIPLEAATNAGENFAAAININDA